MNLYNKVMLYFWLMLSIVSAVIVIYMGITEGFDRWLPYFVVPIVALLMYFFKKWMVNRMHKHLEYLNEKERNKNA